MFVVDMHNNIGRHCNISGNVNETNRCWKVMRAMKVKKTPGSVTHYLVKHIGTKEFRVVALSYMYNLY